LLLTYQTEDTSMDRTSQEFQLSDRLGTLTRPQLQAALDRFDAGTLLGAEVIPFGLFGQNVFVRTDRGDYVMRCWSHYPWQFPKERFFANLLHERTAVPVPWPYLVDTSTDIFGWDFALMPALPGIRLADPGVRASLAEEDRRDVARAIGEVLAEMQAARGDVPRQYDLDADDLLPFETSWAEWIMGRMRQCLTEARAHSDRTRDADVAWVESVIEEAGEALEAPFTPVPVHSDFAYNNMLAERTEAGWRISGVVDLMDMYMGDGEIDLSLVPRMYVVDGLPDCAAAFLRRYLELRPPRPLFLQRFKLYTLLYVLIGWAYGQRHPELNWWDPTLTLREYVEPILNDTVAVVESVSPQMRPPR
jgi:aminoglycoside phosphotransferase (APT) family kinase protein